MRGNNQDNDFGLPLEKYGELVRMWLKYVHLKSTTVAFNGQGACASSITASTMVNG
jgi:hypothetical protein